MVFFPIDKYLSQDYRNTLKTFDSPQNIDTDSPLIPVIDIQKGFPKPNAKQRFRYAMINVNNAATGYQVASVSNSLKIYFIGFYFVNNAAVSANANVFDAISGTGSAPGANAMVTEENGLISFPTLPATAGTNIQVNPILPIEMKAGIRVYAGGGTQNAYLFVYWIEEIV